MALPIAPLPREQPSPPRKLMKLAFLDDDRSGGGLGLVWLGMMIAGAVLGPLWIMRGPWPLGVAVCAAVVVRPALTPRLLRAARGRAPALSGGDLARLRWPTRSGRWWRRPA
jgi:hypothetical protein